MTFGHDWGYVLHDLREWYSFYLDDEVNMISHKTEGMDMATELFDGILEYQVEPIPVAVFKEDRIAGIAAKNDVITCTGIMNALFAGHSLLDRYR